MINKQIIIHKIIIILKIKKKDSLKIQKYFKTETIKSCKSKKL